MNVRRGSEKVTDLLHQFTSTIINQRRGPLLILITILLLSISLFNDAQYLLSSSPSLSTIPAEEAPFVMCDRTTPLNYTINPITQHAIYNNNNNNNDGNNNNNGGKVFEPRWPTQNKLLLLRKDEYTFGNIGNQINSLLHAYSYARDHELQLGATFHSWAIDTIQFMGYEGNNNTVLKNEIWNELGIRIIRSSADSSTYDEIIQFTAKELYFYKSPSNQWESNMEFHIGILRRILLRYNHAHGYAHHGLRATNVCETIENIFHEQRSQMKYTVIHSRYMEGRAQYKLEQLAKTSGLTPKGPLEMSPRYIRSILKPLGMLSYPIILFSDGELPSVEMGLLNDPVIGPKLIVLGNKTSLSSPDTALALLSTVYIGNPASVTSGYIARSRYALGYNDDQTYMFRKEHLDKWISVCNSKCIFNPWIMNVMV